MKKTLAHTTWECKYHIVWVPKNRRKVIYGKLKRDIGQILRKLCEYKEIDVLEGTACNDHIHICLSIPYADTEGNRLGQLNKILYLFSCIKDIDYVHASGVI